MSNTFVCAILRTGDKMDSKKYETIITDEKEIIKKTRNFHLIQIAPFLKKDQFFELVRREKNVLVVSENPITLCLADQLNVDTCMINNGHNDVVSFHPTYEVSKRKVKEKSAF